MTLNVVRSTTADMLSRNSGNLLLLTTISNPRIKVQTAEEYTATTHRRLLLTEVKVLGSCDDGRSWHRREVAVDGARAGTVANLLLKPVGAGSCQHHARCHLSASAVTLAQWRGNAKTSPHGESAEPAATELPNSTHKCS